MRSLLRSEKPSHFHSGWGFRQSRDRFFPSRTELKENPPLHAGGFSRTGSPSRIREYSVTADTFRSCLHALAGVGWGCRTIGCFVFEGTSGSAKVDLPTLARRQLRTRSTSRPALRPMPKPFVRLAHRHGQGYRLAKDLTEVEFRGLALRGKTAVQGLHKGGFDLGTGVQFAGPGQDHGVEGGLLAAILRDDDVPDVGPLPVSGRSTNQSSSQRPLRSISGGSLLTSFAVATTKTGCVLSWSQFSIVSKTRALVPPSVELPEPHPRNPSRSRRSRERRD